MGLFRLAFFGGLLLLASVGWSWLKAQRSRWIVKRRGTVGWLLAAGIAVFLVAILKALLP
jgi:hypothetical protein